MATPQTLREFRKQRGLTVDALAIIGNVAPSTISRIETGRQKARAETVVRLALGLGVSARRMKTLCDSSRVTAEVTPEAS